MQHAPGFLDIVNEAKTRVSEIDADTLESWITQNKSFVLIDVREQSEFAAGAIAKAIHLSKGVIERDIEKTIFDKSVPLVLYCSGGFRSVLAADNIQKMGYSAVWSLTGGSKNWLTTGREFSQK